MDKSIKRETILVNDSETFLQTSSVIVLVAAFSLGIEGTKGGNVDAQSLLDKFKDDDKTSLIHETIALNSGELLSELREKPKSYLTSFEKMDIARIGVSKKGLEQLKIRTMLDYDRLAKMLSTTKVTLINKKGDEKFNSSLSEKILSVADIYSYGYEVFEDEERFNNWMLRPNRALGGKAPYEIMDNQFGREEVRDVIGRIDYGVYS